MLRNNADEKAEIYETLSSMNRAFAGILQHLQTLHRTGLFKSKAAKLFPSFTLELQAEFNQEFLEHLHQLELDDWGRYGKARQKWEKHVRDPDDVFIHAEERRRELAKQRPLKKSKALRSRPVTARQSKQSSPHFAARRLRKR
jgi:hypothetical protein